MNSPPSPARPLGSFWDGPGHDGSDAPAELMRRGVHRVHAPSLRAALAAGANPNARDCLGLTPLMALCQAGMAPNFARLECARALSAASDLSALAHPGHLPGMFSCMRGTVLAVTLAADPMPHRLELLDILVAAGACEAEPELPGVVCTGILWAAALCGAPAASLLTPRSRRGARDRMGRTDLMVSMPSADVELFSTLLPGADLSAVDRDGFDALGHLGVAPEGPRAAMRRLLLNEMALRERRAIQRSAPPAPHRGAAARRAL